MREHRRGFLSGAALMLALVAVLTWVPIVGPFVAGFFGGRQAGNVARSLLAAILPAASAGVFLFLLLDAVPVAARWAFASQDPGVFAWVLLHVLLVLVGAAVGGWSSEVEEEPFPPEVVRVRP